MYECPLSQASAFGVMGVDHEGRVISFKEKPERPMQIPSDPGRALVSMGIYVFSRKLLEQLLHDDHQRADSSHDFGKDILPGLIRNHAVYAYQFASGSGRVSCDGYWRDVGTVDAYFDANMDLLKPSPPMDLYQVDWPIRTMEAQAAPARIVPGAGRRPAEVQNSMLASGTEVAGAVVNHSILSRSVRVQQRAEVEESILFDGVHIDEGVKIRRCIVDKNVKIPSGERIGFDLYRDSQRFVVSESGIVIVPKNYRFNCATNPRKIRPVVQIGERLQLKE